MNATGRRFRGDPETLRRMPSKHDRWPTCRRLEHGHVGRAPQHVVKSIFVYLPLAAAASGHSPSRGAWFPTDRCLFSPACRWGRDGLHISIGAIVHIRSVTTRQGTHTLTGVSFHRCRIRRTAVFPMPIAAIADHSPDPNANWTSVAVVAVLMTATRFHHLMRSHVFTW